MKTTLNKMLKTIIPSFFLTVAQADVNEAMELFKKHNGLDKHEEMTFTLFESELYYSASVFAKRQLIKAKNVSPEFEQVLERLVQKTGSDSFSDLPTEILNKHAKSAPTLAFTLGSRYFKEQKYAEARNMLVTVPQTHRFYPEAQLILGSSSVLKKDMASAIKHFEQCRQSARNEASRASQEKLKRYYVIIVEQCQVNGARLDYANSNFTQSLASYESIDKRSYLWPSLLLEKAWNSYRTQDYNRALGLLVTYKSPFLSQYFFPEAEVLAALSYYQLCLWDDALTVVEHFYQHYAPKSEELKKVIASQKESHDWFYELAFKSKEEQEQLAPYIPQVMTQIKKSVKFSLDLIGIRKAEQELAELAKLPPGLFRTLLLSEVGDSRDFHRRGLNHFIKGQIFGLINQINTLGFEMFNIKLEIMSKKRDLLYKNQQLIAGRSRGDSSNVKRQSHQYFWDFKGEFWADELGEYSFGLKSNCEIIRQESTPAATVKEGV